MKQQPMGGYATVVGCRLPMESRTDDDGCIASPHLSSFLIFSDLVRSLNLYMIPVSNHCIIQSREASEAHGSQLAHTRTNESSVNSNNNGDETPSTQHRTS
eukprot:scaffold2197_cov57-Attheya_sp.AAC.4